MLPNFRNVYKQDMDFQGGYMSFYGAGRTEWQRGSGEAGVGAEYKKSLLEPGGWYISMMMQGETVPLEKNQVRLSNDHKDDWGIPLLVTSIDYTDNDHKMKKDFWEQGAAMLEKAGCKNINPVLDNRAPGNDIHEMGGVRMGNDPKTSLLNKWNQLHHCENVFVTDGACMVSTGMQNPSLTFMAMTARAANHAVEELKKGNV